MNQFGSRGKTDKKANTAPLITLYIGGLDKEVTEEQLCSYFTKYRSFRFLRIPKDEQTQRPRGFAFVNFTNPEDAEMAKNTLQAQKIGRNPVRISYKTNENVTNSQVNAFIPKKNEKEAIKPVSSSANTTSPSKTKTAEVVKTNTKVEVETNDKELQSKILESLRVKLAKFMQLEKQKQKNILGELIYPKVEAEVGLRYAPKITGMLVDFEVLSVQEIVDLLGDRNSLLERIKEAKTLIDEAVLRVPINSSA